VFCCAIEVVSTHPPGQLKGNDMASEGKFCPSCNKDIGIWAIVKLGWPTMLKCPHCKTRLKYESWQIPLTILSIVLYIPIVILVTFESLTIVVKYYSPVSTLKLIGGGIFSLTLNFLVWQLFELLIAYRLRNNSKLVIKNR
jgi:hypothetical protein